MYNFKTCTFIKRIGQFISLCCYFDQLGMWEKKWLMKFNFDNNCEVLRFEKLNQRHIFSMNGRALGNVAEQRNKE